MKNKYIFTRIFIAVFVIIGLIIAIYPGLVTSSKPLIINGEKIYFDVYTPTYTAIFGGNFETKIALNSTIDGLSENAIIQKILDTPVSFKANANIFVAVFLVLSLIILPIYLIKIKSRLINFIAIIIFVITTISFATSSYFLNLETVSNSTAVFEGGLTKLTLGFTILVTCYGIATMIMVFHLCSILMKPNSLKSKSN